DNSTGAFVVTEDVVSILDFEKIRDEGSHIARTVALGLATQAEALDVSITPDGQYALARPAGEGVLKLADLTDPDAPLRTLDLTEIFRRAQAAANNPDDSDETTDAGAPPPVDSGADSAVGETEELESDAGLPEAGLGSDGAVE